MTTKDLISLIQQADPSGEIEVCVGTEAVIGVDKIPSYYDGSLPVFHYEGNRLVAASMLRDVWKVRIYTRSIESALVDHPKLPVSVQDEYDQELVDSWRAQAEQIEREIQEEEEKVVERYLGFVAKHYDDSRVLKLWNDQDERIILEREFDNAFLDSLGIKEVGCPVEMVIAERLGRPKVKLKPLGRAPETMYRLRRLDPNFDGLDPTFPAP